MKISKEYLKRVIAEEIDRTLSEGKKMKIAVKGKKKSIETEGAFGSGYDDYDYVRDTAPSKMNPWDVEAEEARRKEMQKWKDEESAKRDREYREMDDYDRSSRSDESMHFKKKSKKLDEYEYSDEKGVYGSSSPGHSSSPSYSGKTLSKKQRDDEEDDYREKKRGEKETKRKYQGDMSSGN